MTPDDRAAFLEVVVGFAELKGKQLSAPGLELYWRAMQGWSLADFRAAAEQLIRACEFMPTPKDFEDLRKANELTAGEAWADVLEYVRRGGDDEADFGDQPRTVAAVRAIGGFRAIAMSRTDQTPFLERRFAEHYESISNREDVREALPHLTGGPRLAAPVRLLLERLTVKP